ncbi:MAG TPA: NADPH dehydrogenase NamA [Erysipelotrichaceae bacterium]|nr:NADPH dehydrogenase NamA [Erysipelotrichaceae bacterium]
MLSLTPYKIRNIELKNRIVMPPMCMYQAENGFVQAFHLTHYATRAVGNVGMIIVEATAVSPEGRITDNDLGIWDDQFIPGLKQITDEIHRYGSKAFIQLAHAGRKSQSSANPHVAPSAISFSDQYELPVAMEMDEILELKQHFVQAAIRAVESGFDGIEIHGAHGYLIHEFLSPLSNHRTDTYGGTLDNRARLLREVLQEVKAALPESILFQVRISASDYDSEGLTVDDVITALEPVKDILDFVHVSSGGNVTRPIDLKPAYQVPFSKRIKEQLQIPTIAVGLINNTELIESVLEKNDADLIALGRELLRNPYFVNQSYAQNKQLELIPESYLRAYK